MPNNRKIKKRRGSKWKGFSIVWCKGYTDNAYAILKNCPEVVLKFVKDND